MNEVALFPWWVTLIFASWAAIGPLAGILVGHYLARSWQRKQWVADNQMDEYRRILESLNRLNVLLVQRNAGDHVGPAEINQAVEAITRAFNTSLFTYDFLEKSKVARDIISAVRKIDNSGGFNAYQEEYWRAVNLIVASAKKAKI